MSDAVERGRLHPASAAPDDGEANIELARFDGVIVEQILSGRVTGPLEFVQPHAEWVTVLEGTAELDVDGERLALSAGDWALLPAGRPHRLLTVEPGTSWLAVHGPPTTTGGRSDGLIVRRERAGDVEAIRRVHAGAFPCPEGADQPVEVRLVDELRVSNAWVPALSLVAEMAGEVVGHVVCTRAMLGAPPVPALGLGPLGVLPAHQRCGVGVALVRAVIGAADAQGEALVALLGDVGYYERFGFRPAAELGIEAPDPSWSIHFQALPLSAYDPSMRGPFRYATPFDSAR